MLYQRLDVLLSDVVYELQYTCKGRVRMYMQEAQSMQEVHDTQTTACSRRIACSTYTACRTQHIVHSM